ncbi:hypothetical protein ASG90_16510 [Nocardioides sp. Soil797]|nr:hypothetical protein ASG90_16510 [Nocardioides sp. Soil797]
MVNTPTDVQLPSRLPILPGLVLSGRYLLTETEPINRGDTLDVVLLPDGSVALLVADVVGHGVSAVVAVAQVRAVLRQRLSSGVGLLSALRDADQYAEQFPETCATTVCLAVIDRSGGVQYACAGQVPPLLLGADGRAELLPGLGSRPLGTGGEFRVGHAALGPQDALVLHTDGLNGSPQRSVAEARELLRRVARKTFLESLDDAAPVGQRGDDLCAQILGQVAPAAGAIDDTALLVAVRSPPPETFEFRLPAATKSPSDVRGPLNDWLDGLGAGLSDHIGISHAVVELVSNAARHAYQDGAVGASVQVFGELQDDGSAALTVSDQGCWSTEPSDGHGLMMAAGLADSITVRRDRTGTSVDLRFLLARPVPMLRSVRRQAAAKFEDFADDELRADASPGHLTAVGPIDEVSVELFHASLEEATRAGTTDAVIDLSGVTHLASPGVQSLFEFLGRAKRSRTSVSLVAPPDSPAGQILELVGLESRV